MAKELKEALVQLVASGQGRASLEFAHVENFYRNSENPPYLQRLSSAFHETDRVQRLNLRQLNQ